MREVKNDIFCNIKRHEPYWDIDYEDLNHNIELAETDDEDDNNEFSMINPNLLDLNITDGSV